MKVIYPGSFNPWTVGHQHIYERACKIFGEVIIVIAINTKKDIAPNFIAWTLEPLNVPIEIYHDLIASHADIIVRGVRSGDWEYEQNLAQWNTLIGAETVFLSPVPELAHINSTAVRLLDHHDSVDMAKKYVGNDHVYNRWKIKETWQTNINGDL